MATPKPKKPAKSTRLAPSSFKLERETHAQIADLANHFGWTKVRVVKESIARLWRAALAPKSPPKPLPPTLPPED